MLIDKRDEFRGDLDSLSHDGWAINRKIMNDHQIISEEIGKYRPHEIGQHVNRVRFTIIGKSYHDNKKIFSSCLGKIDSFS